jgi:hypothetical protein
MLSRKNLLKHLERREVTAGTLSDANRNVAQVDESLDLRPWPGKNGEATHSIQVRHKLPHPGPSITGRNWQAEFTTSICWTNGRSCGRRLYSSP